MGKGKPIPHRPTGGTTHESTTHGSCPGRHARHDRLRSCRPWLCGAGKPSATATPAPAGPLEGKVPFTGDYTKTTPADSAEMLELSKQWYSAGKKGFREIQTGCGGPQLEDLR
jgi:hypothetical protein